MTSRRAKNVNKMSCRLRVNAQSCPIRCKMTSRRTKTVNKRTCRERVDAQICHKKVLLWRRNRRKRQVVQILSIRGRVEDVSMRKVVLKKTSCGVELDAK